MDLQTTLISNELAELIANKLVKATQAKSYGRWLTMEEAKEYAKVRSVNTIKKWITQGFIYANKRTGTWIIDRQSIDDWFLSED